MPSFFGKIPGRETVREDWPCPLTTYATQDNWTRETGMESKELADAIRAVFGCQKLNNIASVGDMNALADRLSPVETFPKWFVFQDFPDRPGHDLAAFWKWESSSQDEAVYVTVGGKAGKRSLTSLRWDKERLIEVTEAEAKAYVRPTAPAGKKLTGEFRVPVEGEDKWCTYDGRAPLCDNGLMTDFNGGKRWIAVDDDTCPTCNGSGKVPPE